MINKPDDKSDDQDKNERSHLGTRLLLLAWVLLASILVGICRGPS